MLHSPVLLDVKEDLSASHKLQQFYLETSEEEKYLVLFVFLKLGLLKGKGLIFVRDVNKCYRLKLFLQQFFLSSAVISAEVPFNSRIHMVQEFNQGVFDYLIATDKSFVNTSGAIEADKVESEEEKEEWEMMNDDGHEEVPGDDVMPPDSLDIVDDDDSSKEGASRDDGDSVDEDHNEKDPAETLAGSSSSPTKERPDKTKDNKRTSIKSDDDFGVSRGIDFVGISFVINFDFPETVESYAHRIGRTARSTAYGTSLSFVVPEEVSTLQEVRQHQPHMIEGGSNERLECALSAQPGRIRSDRCRGVPPPAPCLEY